MVVVTLVDGEPESINTGSGVAVAPDRILTNAHVLADAAEGEAIIGVVPSEGRQRFTGRLIAYQPGRDLALIQLTDGRVEPATVATGPVPDGAAVAALGYPYSVDRARELSAEGFVTPQAPIKSWGRVSGGASSQRFDTVLHDAAIGRGNSGGPLVDACGRVVGINSFVTNSEGVDAVFGFAVSVRELLPFLRGAGVRPQVTALPCRSSAEQAAIDRQLERSEAERAALARDQAALAGERRAGRREAIRDRILAERDEGLAVAGLLLVFGALFLSGAGTALATGRPRIALGAGLAGLLLMVGAPVAWVARPDLDQADRRLAAETPKAALAAAAAGPLTCTPDMDRSRLTVSDPQALTLDWRSEGCEAGRTQFADDGSEWTRGEVSAREAVAALRRFDPAAGRMTVERFFLSADAAATARALQARAAPRGCGADALDRADQFARALKPLLPPAPNERIVYSCTGKPLP